MSNINCPECSPLVNNRPKYRDGFTMCTDCQIAKAQRLGHYDQAAELRRNRKEEKLQQDSKKKS